VLATDVTHLVGLVMNARRDEIIKLRKSGLSYAKIGRRFGISRERARQIFKGESTQEKPDLGTKAMLRVGEVANLLGIHINTVRRWEDKGALKGYRVGTRGDRRFRREDIDSLLTEEQAVKPPDTSQ
jgi:excisionase family DNA binding protein